MELEQRHETTYCGRDATLRLKYEDLPLTVRYKDVSGRNRRITIKKSDFVKIEHRGRLLYFNKRFFENLEIIVRDVAGEVRDFLSIVSGPERVGKSFGLKQICFVVDYILFKNHGIDSKFDLDNIHFSAKDYMNTRKENVGVKFRIDDLDESKTDLDKKNRYDDTYKDFENYLAYCGSEYGFHFTALPLWSDMGDYCILHRATLQIHFKAYRDEEGRAIKGIYDIYSFPYFDNVTVRGKTRNQIKEIINYWYKHKRFSPLPGSIKAMTGVCLDYEVVNERSYDRKKDAKKIEYIHKDKNEKKIHQLTEAEKSVLKTMPVCKMYNSKTAEYKALMRLQKKLEKETQDNS